MRPGDILCRIIFSAISSHCIVLYNSGAEHFFGKRTVLKDIEISLGLKTVPKNLEVSLSV